MNPVIKPSIATVSLFPDRHETHLSISALPGYTKSLLRSLSIDDKIQHLVLANKRSTQTEHYLDNDIMVYRCWRKGTVLYLKDLCSAIKKFPSLSVIHLQHEFNQFGGLFTVGLIPVFCFLIRYLFRKKLVLTLHEVLEPGQFSTEFNHRNFIGLNSSLSRFFLYSYYKLLATSVNLFFVHTDEAKKYLSSSIKMDVPVIVIPHGIENKTDMLSKSDARTRLKIPQDQKVILFFGMLDRRKGIDLAIDAVKNLNESYLLLVIGGMSERLRKNGAYQNWFTQLKLRMATEPGIRYDGYANCADIEIYFRASDLVLLPYTQPGSSSGVLALSIGYERPVLTTEFVRPVIESNPKISLNPDEISKTIENHFNESLRTKVTSDLSKLYAWEIVANRVSKYYQSLLLGPNKHIASSVFSETIKT